MPVTCKKEEKRKKKFTIIAFANKNYTRKRDVKWKNINHTCNPCRYFVPGRSIGSAKVPETNLKNSGMKLWDIKPDSLVAICLSEDKSAIYIKVT